MMTIMMILMGHRALFRSHSSVTLLSRCAVDTPHS